MCNFFSAFLTILIGILTVEVHELHILNTTTNDFGGIIAFVTKLTIKSHCFAQSQIFIVILNGKTCPHCADILVNFTHCGIFFVNDKWNAPFRNVLGKISDERFCRMSANYEKEQKELLAAVEHDEQSVRKAEQEKIDLKVFLEAIRECTDLKELTPTIVNTLIKRIEVHNSEKGEDGLKHVPVDISFTAVGIINIPTEKELIAAMEEMRENPLKSA